jgi:hypothetical protein
MNQSSNPSPVNKPMPTPPNAPVIDDEIVAQLRAIMERVDMPSYVTLAAAIGASPTTVRLALLTGRTPAQREARAKFRAFIERNADAKTRSELRFV